jgi:hypothetical protein
MGRRIPGPICAYELGSDWIDEGTSCRARSNAPGPIGIDDITPSKVRGNASGPMGLLISMVMAAAPLTEDERAERARQEWLKNNELEKKQAQENLERDTPEHIKKCIAKLASLPIGTDKAWRSPQEQKLILKKLEELNSAKKINWIEGEDRGGHDRGNITINKDFHSGDWGKDAWMKSAPVLVHEATHAVWSDRYFEQFRIKWKRDHLKSCQDYRKGEELIAEETYAWQNELMVYKILQGQGFSDMVLEYRLQRAGSVEDMVREAYPAWRLLK